MFELLTSNEANDVWKHLCFQLKSSESSGYVKRDENIEKFASSYKSEPAGKHVFIHESEEVFMIIFLSEFRWLWMFEVDSGQLHQQSISQTFTTKLPQQTITSWVLNCTEKENDVNNARRHRHRPWLPRANDICLLECDCLTPTTMSWTLAARSLWQWRHLYPFLPACILNFHHRQPRELSFCVVRPKVDWKDKN